MRYRPFGATGTAVSAISLAMTDSARRMGPSEWTNLVHLALENGVNCFEIVGRDPAILDGLAHGIKTLDRHLLFIALRLGSTGDRSYDFSPASVARTVEGVLARTGFDYLDAVLLDDPADDALPPDTLGILKALRAADRTRMIGISGSNPAVDAYITTRAFDVLAIPYGLTSGWITRNRIRAALDHDMSIIGQEFCSEELCNPPTSSLLTRRGGLLGTKPSYVPGSTGTYAFLHETRGWTPQEICLAYALTQPALATVQITTDQAAHLEKYCDVAEREMPPGVASRIEMARFGGASAQAKT